MDKPWDFIRVTSMSSKSTLWPSQQSQTAKNRPEDISLFAQKPQGTRLSCWWLRWINICEYRRYTIIQYWKLLTTLKAWMDVINCLLCCKRCLGPVANSCQPVRGAISWLDANLGCCDAAVKCIQVEWSSSGCNSVVWRHSGCNSVEWWP